MKVIIDFMKIGYTAEWISENNPHLTMIKEEVEVCIIEDVHRALTGVFNILAKDEHWENTYQVSRMGYHVIVSWEDACTLCVHLHVTPVYNTNSLPVMMKLDEAIDTFSQYE